MKQLITRIEESLHRKLKAKAGAEGRSVNDLVTELIRREVGAITERDAFRTTLMAAGLLVVSPKPQGRGPSLSDVLDANRGSGPVVSEYLDWARGDR